MAGLVLAELIIITTLLSLAFVFLRITLRVARLLLFTKPGLIVTGTSAACLMVSGAF